MNTTDDQIEKVIRLDASLDRVWQAVTDHEEFGRWFRVALDQPFEEGARSTGKMTYPGHEGLPWVARVERIEPKRYFAFSWHDYDPDADKAPEDFPTMLVEFEFESSGEGTQLTIRESGFSALGEGRAVEVMRRNAQGWDIQAQNITDYVASG